MQDRFLANADSIFRDAIALGAAAIKHFCGFFMEFQAFYAYLNNV